MLTYLIYLYYHIYLAGNRGFIRHPSHFPFSEDFLYLIKHLFISY